MRVPGILQGSSAGCAKASSLELGNTRKYRFLLPFLTSKMVLIHSSSQELAKYSPVPVLNALSSLWHPTQVLADLLTLHEHAHLFDPKVPAQVITKDKRVQKASLPKLRPLTVAYVGDSANVLHDMLVTYPRLGHTLRVASPEQYRAPTQVWDRVKELGCDQGIWWGSDPKEAVKDADVVVTDTWFVVFARLFKDTLNVWCRISMGQEAEKEERLKAFAGYQVTEELCAEGGAKPQWKFLHCLPRKQHEVDDEVPFAHFWFSFLLTGCLVVKVFYGPRSLVFSESDNRKWTIMALFECVQIPSLAIPLLNDSEASSSGSGTFLLVVRRYKKMHRYDVQLLDS